MNLVHGKIASIEAGEVPLARVSVRGARKQVALLVADAVAGDTVLVCDGVAIGKVEPEKKESESHVSGHPR